MAILQVGANGKAPAGAKVGDTIKTAGGDYKITGGTAGNWTSTKVPSSPSSPTPTSGTKSSSGGSSSSSNNSNKSSSSSTPYTYQIGSPEGIKQANNLAIGGTYNARDGSVWKKNADNTISVTTKSGQTYASNYVPQAATPASNYKTTTYRDPTGKTQTGYIIDNQTFKDIEGKERIDYGSRVTTNGKEYLMSEAGKGIDLSANEALSVYNRDSELGLPDISSAAGQVYMLDGSYYDATTGRLAGAGIIGLGNGMYYDTESGKQMSETEIALMRRTAEAEARFAEIEQAYKDRIAAEQAYAEQQLLAAQQQGNQALDEAASQSEIDAYKAMDNQALRSAKLGDMGGIGQKQYGEAANANDKRLLEISLERKNLETSTQQQIAQLEAQGKREEAQLISELGMKQLELLIAEEDKLRAAIEDRKQTEAQLLGTYNGQPTLDSQNVTFNRALQRLQLGIFTDQDALTLGIPQEQARQFTQMLNLQAQLDLEKAKKMLAELTGAGTAGRSATSASSSSASSSSASSTTGVSASMTERQVLEAIGMNRTPEGQAQAARKLIEQGAKEAYVEAALRYLGLQ